MIPAIYPVTSHTDHVGPGSTFVAIKGVHEDGACYIPLALNKGATKIVVEETAELNPEIIVLIQQTQAELIRVDNARQALAYLSAAAYNFSAKKLKIIGVTGTKGKSTTVFLLEHILASAGYRTALLSTVKNKILDQELATTLTTQQPDYLHTFFYACVQNAIDFVIMEVAAQAFSLHRVYDIEFELGIFTNFSQEHAEFYTSMDEYFATKAQLIKHLKPQAKLLLNADDECVVRLTEQYKKIILCKNARMNVEKSLILSENFEEIFVSKDEVVKISSQAQFTILQDNLEGLKLFFTINNQEFITEIPALTGTFNAYNALMAATAAYELGVSIMDIQQALITFAGVPGRLNRYQLPNGATAFIDYAHNPSSFDAVLSTLKKYTDDLIVVFGCGGERDVTKRPLMGACAQKYADKIILTSDNPRSEDPQDIINTILSGIIKNNIIFVELDRERAIHHAYQQSHAGSIIVLLGKGPDEYQLIHGSKYPFSERSILQSLS